MEEEGQNPQLFARWTAFLRFRVSETESNNWEELISGWSKTNHRKGKDMKEYQRYAVRVSPCLLRHPTVVWVEAIVVRGRIGGRWPVATVAIGRNDGLSQLVLALGLPALKTSADTSGTAEPCGCW